MQTTLNSFNLLNQVNMEIETLSNPFNLEMEDLFSLGARVNPKRSFLFVSKLLGKHLEVHPDIPKLSGHLLSNLFALKNDGAFISDMDELIKSVRNGIVSNLAKKELIKTRRLKEETLFLGFAETATGIGHAVFSAFKNAHYVHTTREVFQDRESVFNFQEEHSHATDHLCYLSDKKLIESISHIVLIDDEITTGNTCLNLIRSLNAFYPNKRYTIMSLLDWRTDEQVQKYSEFINELNLEVETISLFRGSVSLTKDTTFEVQSITEPILPDMKDDFGKVAELLSERVKVTDKNNCKKTLTKFTGRFGMDSSDNQIFETEAFEVGKRLAMKRKGKNTLCIGSGELMYNPSRIASYMGKDVSFKSSTRSPIYISSENGYPIHDRMEYQLENGITNYIYNLKDSGFDEVFMFFENDVNPEIMQVISKKIKSKGIKHVTFVTL